MCAVVNNTAGEQEVITAGGYGPVNPTPRDLVEIYNLRSGQWRAG